MNFLPQQYQTLSLTATLQAFESTWLNSRNQQSQQKGIEDDRRTNRSKARQQVELELLNIIHAMGSRYPGDAEKCLNFFSFNLLTRTTNKRK